MIRAAGPPIPRTALIVGLCAVIPPVWAVLNAQSGAVPLPGGLGPERVILAYTALLVCFMGGALWGQSARASRPSDQISGAVAAICPVAPVLFAGVFGWPLLWPLMAGLVIVPAVDALMVWRASVPGWWVKLRGAMSLITLVCLAYFR